MLALVDLRLITNKGLLSGRRYGTILATNLLDKWVTAPHAVEILVDDEDLVTSSFFVGIMSTIPSAKAWRLIGGDPRTQDEYQRALRRIQGLTHGQHCNISKTWHYLSTKK